MSADEQSSEEQSAEVSISVDDEYVGDLDEVAERLRALGLSVDELLSEIGIITGHIAESQADDLETVEGVAHVERSREYQLPAPDSEIQ
jgi:DNA-binding ferritin-like protein